MGESVKFYSRSGKEFTTFEHLKAPVGKMVTNWLVANTINMKWFLEEAGAGLVIEAEVVSGSFNKTVSEVRRKDEQATDAVLCMFDVLPLATFTREEKKGCELAGPWLKRRQRIEQLMTYAPMTTSLRLLETQKVNSEEEIHTMYEEFRAKGLEGAIVKDPIALYHRRRNHAWTKIKAEESVDVPITGAIEGTGKYQGKLGALVVNYNGVAVNVGSGLSDEQREEFWDAHKRDEQRCADGEDGIPVDDFELLNRTIEVEYHEVTPDGSLRHPRFKRFRDDKAVQS
jgi:DNA ligase-1